MSWTQKFATFIVVVILWRQEAEAVKMFRCTGPSTDVEAGRVKMFRCTGPPTEPSTQTTTIRYRTSTAQHDDAITTHPHHTTTFDGEETTANNVTTTNVHVTTTSGQNKTTTVEQYSSTGLTATTINNIATTEDDQTTTTGGGVPSTTNDHAGRITTVGRGTTARRRTTTENYYTTTTIADATTVESETGEVYTAVFTFLPTTCETINTVLQVSISATEPDVHAAGNISFPLREMSNIPFQLPAGTLSVFDIPVTVMPSGEVGYRKETSTVMITSDVEVTVLAHFSCLLSPVMTATFNVKGTDEIGREYRVATYQNIGNSSIAITALNQQTVVAILFGGSHTNITLSSFESFVWINPGDLTGAQIVADGPVQVIAGTLEENANEGLRPGRDTFCECMTPLKQWGTKFSVVPLSDQYGGFVVRVLPWNRTTTITWTQGSNQWEEVIEPDGSFAELSVFPAPEGQAVEMIADKPVIVVQVSSVYKTDLTGVTPSMSLLTVPPIDILSPKVSYMNFALFDIQSEGTYYLYNVLLWLPPEGDSNQFFINNAVPAWVLAGTMSDGGLVLRASVESSTNVFENRGLSRARAAIYAWNRKQSYAYTLT